MMPIQGSGKKAALEAVHEEAEFLFNSFNSFHNDVISSISLKIKL
jgi:hypothetical protein